MKEESFVIVDETYRYFLLHVWLSTLGQNIFQSCIWFESIMISPKLFAQKLIVSKLQSFQKTIIGFLHSTYLPMNAKPQQKKFRDRRSGKSDLEQKILLLHTQNIFPYLGWCSKQLILFFSDLYQHSLWWKPLHWPTQLYDPGDLPLGGGAGF